MDAVDTSSISLILPVDEIYNSGSPSHHMFSIQMLSLASHEIVYGEEA
jgi:hypothetical protein